MTEWRLAARWLADELVRSGDVVTRSWWDAVSSVPRHALVPHHYVQNDDATWSAVDGGDTVYSDTTLVTALADAPQGPTAVSSSTMPGLMVTMLEALDVRDGNRVLEIGTGTGYNAALLSHRLGSDTVFSVDVDGALVELARERLTTIGYTPTLVTRDGNHGLAEHAPYDRIISTCAVPTIPRPWIEQVTEGGLILTDLTPSGMAGNLVLLQRRGDTATGRFLPTWAGFMPMRHIDDPTGPQQPRRDRTGVRARRTSAPPHPWRHPVPWFLAQFGMPENLTFGETVDDSGEASATFLSATDGSWCEVDTDEDHDGTHPLVENGPSPLWERFEEAYETWQALGEPSWPHLGLTVTPERHHIWLDTPDGHRTWSLAR